MTEEKKELLLSSQFELSELEWRVSRSGIHNGKPWAAILCYVTARAIMNRLDNVVGQFNWSDSYTHIDGGIECKLSIKDDVGRWITKIDASPTTEIEALKGGYSKSLVRAAVKWGIGRYLYYLPAVYATFVAKKSANSISCKIKVKGQPDTWHNWEPPSGAKVTGTLDICYRKCKINWKA